MKNITNVKCSEILSIDKDFKEFVFSYSYKGKDHKEYIFVYKNSKFKQKDYLREARKSFNKYIESKISKTRLMKVSFVSLCSALAITTLTFTGLYISKFFVKNSAPSLDEIVFNAGEGATVELYDEQKVSFPITDAITWDDFYSQHHYLGAVKKGYDFLYWSLDGKEPIDNDYVLEKPVELIPVYHVNNDGVSFVLRHIDKTGETFEERPFYQYKNTKEAYDPNKIKVRKNYGEWETYIPDKTEDINHLVKVGDVVSYKITDSYGHNGFAVSCSDSFSSQLSHYCVAISGDIKALNNNSTNYKEAAFKCCFDNYDKGTAYSYNASYYSAAGLTISGDELSVSCCELMFTYCAQLATAPKILATKMNVRSCYRMFYGCTFLLKAQDLPATTLAESCYEEMFNGVHDMLRVAPYLPATKLAKSCYKAMFYSCSGLKLIKIGYTGDFKNDDASAFEGWLNAAPNTGVFYYNGNKATAEKGVSGIPAGWEVRKF